MKKYFFLLLLAGYTSVSAQSNEKEPYFTKSLSGDLRNVKMKTPGGNISVMSASGSELKVEVYVTSNNSKENPLSKEEIKKRMEQDYDLDVSTSGNKLTVVAEQKDKHMDWKKALNISFKAYVPANVSTDLSTSGGNITLKGLTGTQDFSTSGGNLTVENVGGKVKGRTSGGNLDVKNAKDDIDLSTSGGNINAENCSGNLKLSTSGGNLNLEGLKGIIKASTSGGNVRGSNVDGELSAHTSGGTVILKDMSCSLDASTSGGNIDVAVKQFGKYLKINNSGGNVDLAIPNKGADLKLSADKIRTDGLQNFTGNKDDDEVNGKINGGGTPVTVSASSGRISLSVK